MNRQVIPVLVAVLCIAATTARAAVIYDQSPVVTNSSFSDLSSDADGRQIADNFVLGSADTVRSAVRRGVYRTGNTPTAPLNFTLYIYGDSGGLPDTGNILSQTNVSFSLAQITDTGLDVSGGDVYEFAANVNPVALSDSTTYWFSALGDSSADGDDAFAWTTILSGDDSAVQEDVTGAGGFVTLASRTYYYQLNNVIVPVPAAAWLALPLLGALAIMRKTRIA